MMDIIYTLAPLAPEQESTMPAAEMKLMNYKGVDLYAQRIEDNRYRVLQICTSDPADYLRNDVMPGAIILFD